MHRPGDRLLRGLVIAEAFAFGSSAAVIWLDEWLDLPHRLFGDLSSRARFREAGIESARIALTGALAMFATVLLMQRLRRLEAFIAICAWCRQVRLDGRWMPFEEFLRQQNDLRTTHGICERCADDLKEPDASR